MAVFLEALSDHVTFVCIELAKIAERPEFCINRDGNNCGIDAHLLLQYINHQDDDREYRT